MSNETQIRSLIEQFDKSDPAQRAALDLLLNDFYQVYSVVFPPVVRSRGRSTSSSSSLGAVQNLLAVASGSNLRLNWDVLSGAFRYEIRMGASWAAGVPILSTGSNVANLDPTIAPHILTYGTYTFWVKAVDINGGYSLLDNSVSFTVANMSAPGLTLGVIANNVIMSWSVPTSVWAISYYSILKDGVEIGRINGNFKIQSETLAGTYAYKVIAYDIVGNASPSSDTITVTVNSPIDFTQIGEVPAGYGGTYTHTKHITYGGSDAILGAIVSETWAQHFTNNSWTTIQNQISAGFPLYFEPSYGSAGTYREVFDFGLELDNVNVTVLYNKTDFGSGATITCQIELSLDGITYGSPISAFTTYTTAVRYVRTTLTFTNANTSSASVISGLHVAADVQYTVDSGSVAAISTDASGTAVTYNAAYKSVNSVTATVTGTTSQLTVVTNSITSSGFKVFVFNAAGSRVSATVNWKSRGIV